MITSYACVFNILFVYVTISRNLQMVLKLIPEKFNNPYSQNPGNPETKFLRAQRLHFYTQLAIFSLQAVSRISGIIYLRRHFDVTRWLCLACFQVKKRQLALLIHTIFSHFSSIIHFVATYKLPCITVLRIVYKNPLSSLMHGYKENYASLIYNWVLTFFLELRGFGISTRYKYCLFSMTLM